MYSFIYVFIYTDIYINIYLQMSDIKFMCNFFWKVCEESVPDDDDDVYFERLQQGCHKI
jgi:hypothetical protein